MFVDRMKVLACAFVVSLIGCGEENAAPVTMRVSVTNISVTNQVETSTGFADILLPPGVFVVTPDTEPLYAVGSSDRGQGLEALAEDGSPVALWNALRDLGLSAGIFELSDITYEQGAIEPGGVFVFFIEASRGDRLHLATMLGMSNDSYYATDADGIELFEGRNPRTADVSDQIRLYDLGTEQNEPLAEGANQPAMQSAAGAGLAEDGTVELNTAEQVQAASVIRVTIEPVL